MIISYREFHLRPLFISLGGKLSLFVISSDVPEYIRLFILFHCVFKAAEIIERIFLANTS
jgi:hypothetical protein